MGFGGCECVRRCWMDSGVGRGGGMQRGFLLIALGE